MVDDDLHDDWRLALDALDHVVDKYLIKLAEYAKNEKALRDRIAQLERALEDCLGELEQYADADLELMEFGIASDMNHSQKAVRFQELRAILEDRRR